MNLLLIGVGGVGCEFLILLSELKKANCECECECKCEYALKDLTVLIIDDDVVEESNLSRQRLFSTKDIGRPKVEVASEKLTGIFNFNVVPLRTKVEDIKDAQFFNQFHVIVLAVDNLEARRWVNSTVMTHCDKESDRILLDLGVEGFKFSIRRVVPKDDMAACLECTMTLYQSEDEEDTHVPVCSIYGQPRNLKDCIYWSLSRQGENNFDANDDDNDNLKIVMDLAIQRANEFGIDSYSLSRQSIQELMKRTIPAVASVNSLLAAKGLEVLILSWKGKINDNFWMINLENGFYEMSCNLEKSNDCYICN